MGLEHGIFGWTDVAVPDMEAGAAFYSGVFGWEAQTAGPTDSMPYTMFRSDDSLVAGMGQLTPDQAEAGVPPTWSAYIIVDDVDAIHARAVELGAISILEPLQIMDSGKMSFVMDPTGAAIGFWESGTHGGAEVFNALHTLCWNDLACRDVEGAARFYGDLLGWEATEQDMGGGMMYTMISNAGRMNGGIWDMSGMLPDEIPSHWLNWFVVADCDETCDRVRELGGTVLREPQDSGIGRSAVVADPFGATFGIIATDQLDGQPPR